MTTNKVRVEKAIESKEISTIEDVEKIIAEGKLRKENSQILYDLLYEFQEKYEEEKNEAGIKKCRELKKKIRSFLSNEDKVFA